MKSRRVEGERITDSDAAAPRVFQSIPESGGGRAAEGPSGQARNRGWRGDSFCQSGPFRVRWRMQPWHHMRAIYNILFTFFFLLSAPFYFLKMRRRGNWQEGFGQRFGRFSSKVKQAMTNRH